jgi:DNA-binding response OmpR family regulator
MEGPGNNAWERRACLGREAAMPVSRVLAVDDDPAMRNMIAEYLRGENFDVRTAADGTEMNRILGETAIDLVILDLQLSDEDGLEIVRSLGAGARVPVVVITGQRRDEFDRVLGLELGADDYLTKPFSLRELLARIRAVLRRRHAAPRRPATAESAKRYRFAGWELNLRTRRLLAPSGETVPLTKGELNLLVALLDAPQRVLSREQLLQASRVHDEEVFDRSIDVQILRLRRKLEPDPSNPKLIRTERGAGYVLAAEVEMA